MLIHNKEIADIFYEIADLLDIQGENQFRVRSYRDAARTISESSLNIIELAENEKKIRSLRGIGKSMVKKIKEIAETGTLSQLEKLRKRVPTSLTEILKMEQIGPRRIKVLNKELNIESIEDLRKAANEGKIEKLKGFGKKISDHILQEIEEYAKKGGYERIKLDDAEEMISPVLEYLGRKIKDVTVAGSYRRQKETVGDIDILGTANNSEEAMEHFINFEEIQRVLSRGTTRSSVQLRTGLQVDLRIVKKDSYGAALLYFTGSKAHSIALRKLGQERDLKVNEYGVYREEKRLASRTEKEMYDKLGLQFIEPELREDTGEIEAAKKRNLPDLVTLDDIKGDLQTHTNASDGKYSMEEMVRAAEKLGYAYYAITDHSKRVSMANGLDEKRLAEQIEKIESVNQKMKQLKVLKSIEVDILEDGSLDLPDDILKQLDFVVCAIHYHQKLSKNKQTKRVLKAMENPYFNILAHPTGRIIGKRNGYGIDMEKVMKEAKDKGCFLEINSNPDRLDLNDQFIRQAKEIGLKLSISTDAHSIDHLEYMKYGVAQARRGWLEKNDVINTCSWEELEKLLKRY